MDVKSFETRSYHFSTVRELILSSFDIEPVPRPSVDERLKYTKKIRSQ